MITSTKNSLVQELVQLHQKKHRTERGMFLVEGPHLVEEAHRAGWLTQVLCLKETDYPNTTLVNDIVMARLSTTKEPQGIVGVCVKKQVQAKADYILVIESNDPGNVGTLLRSALAFGFHTVSVASHVDVTNEKVLRASSGAVFHLSICDDSLATLKTKYPKHHVVGASANGAVAVTVSAPLILVVGHETKGVDHHGIDTWMAIETSGVESLNASVAGSILMHRLRG
jgi:RNA methyltransferase, TrmH family